MDSDRNFDDLAPRFANNVYGGLKGALRLAVLERDFAQFSPAAVSPAAGQSLRILDAGGGQGQFALQMAALGHTLSLCDISAEMLTLARQNAAAMGLANIQFWQSSIQALSAEANAGTLAPFDLVLCHAVLEWVVDQQGLIKALLPLVNIGGTLSLSFYNRHGLIMKNLLRGRRPPILDAAFKPSPGSLTPTRPLEPAEVLQWLDVPNWELLCHSGIRVFHDFLLTPEGRAMPEEALLQLECELSRQEPYRGLGRYQHVLLRRLC
jgi:S-adenosylmethionine-dependent methyltransferase